MVDGNRLIATAYDLSFRKNKERTTLCTKKFTDKELSTFRRVPLLRLSLH